MTAATLIVRGLATMLAILLAGFAARRVGLVGPRATASLAFLVAEVGFPLLCVQGLTSVGPRLATLGVRLPAFAFVSLVVTGLVAALWARRVERAPSRRPAFAFAATVGNWIFFPLPVATSLFGDAGAAIVLLHNAGAQLFVWTVGVASLDGSLRRASLRTIARQGGLWGVVVGALLAVYAPGVAASPWIAAPLAVLARVTVPLAAAAIGMQLGDVGRDDRPEARRTAHLVVARLIVVPVPVLALVAALARAGLLSPVEARVEALIAVMPISLTAGALIATRSKDGPLAARAILASSVASLATVPLFYAAASALLPS